MGGSIDLSSSVFGCCPRSKPPEVLSRAIGQRSMKTMADRSRIGLFDWSSPLAWYMVDMQALEYLLLLEIMKITDTYLKT